MNKKLASTAGTIALSAILFTAKFLWDTNARLAVMETQIADQQKQTRQLWKYTTYLHRNSVFKPDTPPMEWDE